MPLILGANSLAGGYQVKNSARFNSGSSDYLNKTSFGTATNRKIFTLSFWVKKTTNGDKLLFSAGTSASTNVDQIYFRYPSDVTENTFDVNFYESSTTVLQLRTTQYFRDPSAWYHFIVAIDSTQATSSNRAKVYLNGTQITSFSSATYPSQNAEFLINSTNAHYIAGNLGASATLDGYLSEFYMIDGQALTPSSFGETDEDTGIWKPKAYTGTFGTNGFYLDFEDSANLGNDMSGNNNDFTVNNLTSIDQTTDTPTNNFATLNPITPNSNNLAEGSLKWQNNSGGWDQRQSTITFSAGKWYAEMKVNTKGDSIQVGIQLPTLFDDYAPMGEVNNSYIYLSDGRIRNNGSNVTTGLSTFTDGDIIGIAVDVTNSLLYFYKNGTLVNSGGTSINSGQDWVFGCGAYDAGTDNVVLWNFGNPPYSSNAYTDGAGYGNFSYAVPSGYYALCTKNLADFG